MKWKYKEEKSFEERLNEALKVAQKYPERVPIIVEKRTESKLPELKTKKFLVEKDSTVAQFLCILRKRLPSMASHETIFFFVNKNIVLLSSQIGDLYTKYADQDKFLYLSYSEENKMSKIKFNYKDFKSFEERLEEAQSIKKIYTESVPVVVQKYKNSNLPELDRKKYIVPASRPISMFYYSLRRQMKLSQTQSLFILINNITPSLTTPMGDLYNKFADEDEFLYICYFDENTFGNFQKSCKNKI